MRLCTFQFKGSTPTFGVQIGRRLLRVEAAARFFGLRPAHIAQLTSTEVYFANLATSEKILSKLVDKAEDNTRPLGKDAPDGMPILIASDEVTFLPPIRRPGKFLCIGLNYKDHCEEQKKELPKVPIVFNKFATSLTGHGAEIPLPLDVDTAVDYEAELGVVIGRTATRVSKKSAARCIGGFVIVNDVSLRTIQKTEAQWARAKGFDGGGPFGPFIVTPDEVPDPHDLDISCVVNGKTLQKSNTSNLVFQIPELISFISQLVTLEPGDVISTGTPGGVGAYRTPTAFLEDGDTVEVRIESLGVLRNTCVKRRLDD